MIKTFYFAALLSSGALVGQASAVEDKYHITAQEHEACDADASRLCMAAYPDENKLLGCMSAKRSQLTPVCLATFDAGMKKRHLRLTPRSASAK